MNGTNAPQRRLDFGSEGGRTWSAVCISWRPSLRSKLDCRLAPGADGSLQVSVQSPVPFSHVNITLMNEHDAVAYRGDGKSAVEFSDLQVS
jgi:hypothetical protein